MYNTICQVKIRDLNANISPENTGPSIGQRERARIAIQRVLFDHLVTVEAFFPQCHSQSHVNLSGWTKERGIYAPFFPTKVFCCKIFERLRDSLNRQPSEIQMKPKSKQLQILAGKKFWG